MSFMSLVISIVSLTVSLGTLFINYLNWQVRTPRIRHAAGSSWRDTSITEDKTVKIFINLENYGDQGIELLKKTCLHFQFEKDIPSPEVVELEAEEIYGKQTFNVYSFSVEPDDSTYFIAVKIHYKNLEPLIFRVSRSLYPVKTKLFVFECNPGLLYRKSMIINSDRPTLGQITLKSRRSSIVKKLPKEFS